MFVEEFCKVGIFFSCLSWTVNTGQQKKDFFCYETNKIVILAHLGALILKIQLVFLNHVTFLR